MLRLCLLYIYILADIEVGSGGRRSVSIVPIADGCSMLPSERRGRREEKRKCSHNGAVAGGNDCDVRKEFPSVRDLFTCVH